MAADRDAPFCVPGRHSKFEIRIILNLEDAAVHQRHHRVEQEEGDYDGDAIGTWCGVARVVMTGIQTLSAT